MSPEEFMKGAVIDGCTNVFGQGAVIFGLLGGEQDRSRDAWQAGEACYLAALKAVQPEREKRYGTVMEFHQAWCQAVKEDGVTNILYNI
jgi:serine/threonine-protein kinase